MPPADEEPSNLVDIATGAKRALDLARKYAWEERKTDSHWCFSCLSNFTVTAEYIFLYKSLGYDVQSLPRTQGFMDYLLNGQNTDGSWSLSPGLPGDFSVSSKAYLVLELLGVPPKSTRMCKARDVIRSAGGVARVCMLTRIFFTEFGLFPWTALPQIPCELILLPAFFPAKIYELASWARLIIVALLLVFHHRPVYALPNGKSDNNDFLDELWAQLGREKCALFNITLPSQR